MQLTFDGEGEQRLAILRLEAPKANAINDAFLSAVNARLDELESAGARALVVTGSGKHFCAGLDLVEVTQLDKPKLAAFMTRFGDLMLRLFSLPQPVVAAMNGHAVAGGCVLALQADVRLMAAGELKIGLNETQLGIGLPSEVIEPLVAQLPPASLLPIALEGRLLSPDEALGLGLIHAVVPPSELFERAKDRARALAALPGGGFSHVKRSLRAPALARAIALRETVGHAWLDTWFDPAAQSVLGGLAKKLSSSRR
jgi:enoyl-CoA hydratase